MSRNQGNCVFVDGNEYIICKVGLDCSFSYLGCGKIRERGIAVFKDGEFIDIALDVDEMMKMLGISQYTFLTCNDDDLTDWLCDEDNAKISCLTFHKGLEQFAAAAGVKIEHKSNLELQ